MSGINPREAQALFKETLEKDKDKSTGLAAIETLYAILKRSKCELLFFKYEFPYMNPFSHNRSGNDGRLESRCR